MGAEGGMDSGGEGNLAGGTTAGASGTGGGVGGSSAEAGAAGEAGQGEVPRPLGGPWAPWPMPNPDTLDLPNPQVYSSTSEVVTDGVTGLIWQKGEGVAAVYVAAVSECETSTLGGFDDWRLPTRIELVSLVDYTLKDPAIDPTFDAVSQPYWTTSPWAGNDDAGYIVHFVYGFTSVSAKSEPAYVRCVR